MVRAKEIAGGDRLADTQERTCAPYLGRLNELSPVGEQELFAAAVAADRSLAVHLAACAVCREAFEAHRAWLAEIDAALSAMVSMEAPAALAARVRQQIARASAAGSWSLRWDWWLIGATAAGVALALALSINRWLHQPESGGGPQLSGRATIEQPASPRAPTVSPLRRPILSGTPPPRAYTGNVAADRSPSSEPAVLVPAGQARAVWRLAAWLESPGVDGSIFVNPPASWIPEQIVIPVLEIRPLEGDSSELDQSTARDSGSSDP